MTGTAHLRTLRPAPNVLAFYDGRIPGQRYMPGPNWVDDGAISLGVASYAIIDGDQALIYDTHVSVPHAAAIRAELQAMGIRRFTVVLSHWHLDHVAGTAVFADSPVIACKRTLDHLTEHKAGIEDASFHGLPAINPLILPTQTFSGEMTLMLDQTEVRLIEANIHSDDACVLWLPAQRLLLAGDTLEDTVTYVGEPESFDIHLTDLARLAALQPLHILPNHGEAARIAAGGYGPGLISATVDYIRHLIRCRDDAAARALPLEQVIAPALAAGDLIWFEPYVDIHAQNLERVLAASH
ncbi:MAG: MBL fold metallo-hydrolase [Rhodobacteraceae bacterium]|nr:MBL fold metallo-hydrolase [Paracoccaceae bacterium]